MFKKNKNQNEIKINDNNEAEIDVFIKDTSSVISPFSISSKPVINSEFALFLNQNILATHLQHNICIKIKSPSLEENDANLIKQAINNYYAEDVKIIERKLSRNTLTSIIFIILSIVILSMIIIFDILNIFSDVILELFDIAGWVFMWEAVDLLFIERPVKKFELLKNHKIINANVIIE